VRRAPWLLLVLLPACAGFQKRADNRHAFATLEHLKSDPKGACGAVVNMSAEAWSAKATEPKPSLGDKMIASSVEACVRILPSGSGPGEGAVVDLAFVFPQQDEHWKPQYWHVEVVRSNGVVVQAATLDEGKIEDGICVLDVCNKEGYATLVVNEPWQVDSYKIRLTHVPTRKHVDVVVTLN
jgi:hypothetical protein